MKIYDLINDDTKRKLGVSNQGKGKHHTQSKKRNKRNSERLTRYEIEELMGTRRDTYKRVNGKIKRK
mgnify:CR=1 FL=1